MTPEEIADLNRSTAETHRSAMQIQSALPPLRPEPYPGNPETWKGEWLEHPMEWIKECFRRAHDTLTHKENSYSMSIPVQRWDPDIVLGDAIEELERLRTAVKAASSEWQSIPCYGRVVWQETRGQFASDADCGYCHVCIRKAALKYAVRTGA